MLFTCKVRRPFVDPDNSHFKKKLFVFFVKNTQKNVFFVKIPKLTNKSRHALTTHRMLFTNKVRN